jgi:hypothetical protein
VRATGVESAETQRPNRFSCTPVELVVRGTKEESLYPLRNNDIASIAESRKSESCLFVFELLRASAEIHLV